MDHLQSQLDRAKALLKVSEQRNVMLAQMIRGGAAGYRGGSPMAGAMPPMMGGGMGATSPTSPAGGMSPMGGIPNLSALSSLIDGGGRRGRSSSPGGNGLNLHSPVHNGPGADAFRAAVRRGLDIKGITDPVARANWETGLMVVGGPGVRLQQHRLSTPKTPTLPRATTRPALFSSRGRRSRPITSRARQRIVATTLVKCVRSSTTRWGRYGVSADGSDLADKIQQADPTRPPKGY